MTSHYATESIFRNQACVHRLACTWFKKVTVVIVGGRMQILLGVNLVNLWIQGICPCLIWRPFMLLLARLMIFISSHFHIYTAFGVSLLHLHICPHNDVWC